MAKALRSQEPAATASSAKYDVFLSFRGEDTRKNFTDHLYRALKQAGVRTFRDDDEMERGKVLKPELEKAIKQSSVSIIVFSKNYASSRWCLDEVLTILEEHKNSSTKHEIIPVFYDVDPSDVRNQRGSFATSFYEHYEQAGAVADDEQRKLKLDKIKAWRAALSQVADLTGMVLDNKHEGNFIDEIVCTIKKKLRSSALGVAEYLVGLDHRISEINSWIWNDHTNILILYGIGGIGKTTTAKCVYNENFLKFEGSCFLADIRENFCQTSGVLRLQSQLISTILRIQKEETVWNVHEGVSKIREAIVDKEVLIVLDDVTDWKQLEELLGTLEFFSGCKIIITTRHKELAVFLGDRCQSCAIQNLSDNQSMELFSWYAFRQSKPRKDCMEKAQVIVRRCEGLPLALKVLGSSLRGRDIAVWEDSLRKLEEIPNSDIQKTLKISYDYLEDDKDRDLFLHIAFFFVGETKDYVVSILEQCGLYPVDGIHNLISRCLLDVEENKLMMHQLIQEMGREIVRQESPMEPGERSRLWRDEDSHNVLKEKNGTEKIIGLSLCMNMLIKDSPVQSANDVDDIGKHGWMKVFSRSKVTNSVISYKHQKTGHLDIDAFKRMKKIMLLRLNHVTLSGSYQRVPKQLRWLCLHGFPSKFLPNELSFERLVALDMSYSKLQKVWNGFKLLGSLKVFNLSYSIKLVETPDFRGLPSLEKLLLRGCVCLVKICKSIAKLKGLVLLDLHECQSLRSIPVLPMSLETIILSGVLNLDAIGKGKWWDSLPRYLITLNISNCNLSCDTFPRDFSHLVSLKCLDMSDNPFTTLPYCVQSIPSLVFLNIRSCQQLQTLTGLPSTLEILNTRDNFSLVQVSSIPDSIVHWQYIGSRILDMVEGCFNSVPVDNVDRNIMSHLSLGSIPSMKINVESISRADIWHGDGKLEAVSRADPIKLWYEFGIFSVSVPGEELPGCYMFKKTGSWICFEVPSHPNNSKISGFNVSFVCRSEITLDFHWTSPQIFVYNKTKDLLWVYIPTLASFRIYRKVGNKVCFVWLSLWKCGEFLEVGDEVFVSIAISLTSLEEPSKHTECDECGVSLVYEDMIPEEDTEKESQHNRSTSQLSWTNKMLVEISDYIHTGKRYYFSSFTTREGGHGNNVPGCAEFIDWFGPKRKSSDRYFDGGLISHIQFQDE